MWRDYIDRLYQNRWVYLALLPALLFTFGLIGYPLINAFWLSFHRDNLLKPFEGAQFIGLGNYIYYFHSPEFWATLGRTALWTSGSVLLKLLVGLGGALLLNFKGKGSRFFRYFLIPPWVIPIAIGAIVWSWMYNSQFGLINSILLRLGIIQEPFAIMGHGTTAFIGALVNDSWVGIPFMVLILLGGLQAIPKQLYEAAKVDGANALHCFIYITLPQLKNVLLIGILLSTVWTFNSFSVIWVHTKGGPINATTTLVIDAYKTTFEKFRLGRSAALSVLIFIVLISASYLYSKFIRLEER